MLGQNVAFVLAAAGPLLRMLGPWWRWATTLLLVGWFVSMTRFEPSIVRAGAMAGLSATAFVLGRGRDPTRLLALAVTILLLVDPLLVESVGFWLSVGATAGVTAVGPRLTRRLAGLGPLAMPVGVTVGAQVGVVVPAMLVFGRLPLVSVPANLLAVPVAGAVMLYGLPAGLVAGLVPPVAPIVMFPCRIGVRWVDTVALLGERLEPSAPWSSVGWAALVVAVALIAAMNRGRHAGTLHEQMTQDSWDALRASSTGKLDRRSMQQDDSENRDVKPSRERPYRQDGSPPPTESPRPAESVVDERCGGHETPRSSSRWGEDREGPPCSDTSSCEPSRRSGLPIERR